jgi:hypothetical protein
MNFPIHLFSPLYRFTRSEGSCATSPSTTIGRVLGVIFLLQILLTTAIGTAAQDGQQDDPPSRVARLGYMEGSVSFQPAGEGDWVQAVPNRPMTTGDKLWADRGSRAELQLGSATIRLSANTGVSFLNLDDQTVQLQLSSGAVNIRVRRLNPDDYFEIDTPNLAFTMSQPGSYRLEASEDGTNTVVSIRAGGGEATGNGQTYTLHAGQRATFGGTESLNADVEQIGEPDQFDTWADGRDRRYDGSRSAQYLSRDCVGYEDLDDYGDWRDDSNYGHVWFPNRVAAGWAPYHEGHWDWIDPWGYTWVDDETWGYAPFHYGRWVGIGGRWGWVPGPPAERPVYAPALVVFVGGGGGFGGNIAWFPLGPREVYVPSYPVSREYVNRVNVSSTTVNTTTITNVYNTTIVNKTTNITNVTYVNRGVPGAVTAVSQRTFTSAQPVAHATVALNAQQIAAMPISARVAVSPTKQSVLGAASTANHVNAPPAAVVNRQVIAKKAPPPPAVSFEQRQQAMAAHPGQPLAKREIASLRPPVAAAARPMVKMAPPGRPATATTGQPNRPEGNRPAQPAVRPPAEQPNNRPEANRPPTPPPPANNRPEVNRPAQPPAAPPPAGQPNNRPETNRPPTPQPPANNRPEVNRPAQPPGARPPSEQPNKGPETNRPPTPPPPANSRPEMNRPAQPPGARPPSEQPNNRPAPNENKPAERPKAPPPNARPQEERTPPEATRPAPPPKKEPAKPQTPEEKKQEEQRKPPGE